MNEETRKEIWRLYYEGVPTWKIARELNLSEYEVISVLGLN